MNIVLGITTRNEIEYGPHIERQLDDALEMDYDKIVILDDGSTDGTWATIRKYERKHPRIKAFRNNKNSVLDPKGTNRWATLLSHMAKFNPTWINVRACDQVYSYYYKTYMREILTHFYENDVHILKFPLAHLWRSETWYRSDNVWGKDVKNHNKTQVWRFSPKYTYKKDQGSARLHQGRHFPLNLGFDGETNTANINDYFGYLEGDDFPIMVLHLGHTTHEKKEAKFRFSMEAAASGFANGMPSYKGMPHPENWLKYNGYKGFHEFSLQLEPVPDIWYGSPVTIDPKPVPKSFYNTIKKYNTVMAIGYKKMFDKAVKKNKWVNPTAAPPQKHPNNSDVVVGRNVTTFPGCVIGRVPMAPKGVTEIDYNAIKPKPVIIGDNSIIGANTVIYSNVKIGKNCLIGDGVHIREDVTIGDNSIIGIGVKVGARTKIGTKTRVMDLTNVASDALLGDNVFIGPGVMMGNDNKMGRHSTGDGHAYTGPIIEDFVTIGMNSSLLPSVKIGRDTIVAAHSVVTKNMPPAILTRGCPARKVRNLTKEEKRNG